MHAMCLAMPPVLRPFVPISFGCPNRSVMCTKIVEELCQIFVGIKIFTQFNNVVDKHRADIAEHLIMASNSP